jgi:hypothetical protein
VVGIHDHANPVGFEPLGDVQSLGEGNDHGPVLHEYRVARFDSELYVCLRSVRRQLADTHLHHDPGGFGVSLRRRSADENQHVGSKSGGLLYGAAVVFEASPGCQRRNDERAQ